MTAPLILGTNSIKDEGYEVANSLRFDDGSSDYLNRTPSSASNRKTWTYSTWIKRSNLSSQQWLFSAYSGNDNNGFLGFRFNADNSLTFTLYNVVVLTTNQVFRDTSAWYHFVFKIDTTEATDTDRATIYVNGEQITSFASDGRNNLTLNMDLAVNTSAIHTIGVSAFNILNFFDGYMAETCLIDGTALDPTSFGEFDEDTGIWKPIDVSGLTFGTNGFYLDFENSGSLGADVSGNGNNFTVNNLTSIDQVTDSPTNNFATMNPLDNYIQGATFSEGNLQVVTGASGYWSPSLSTIGLSKGKWYCEIELDATGGSGAIVGVLAKQVTANGIIGDDANGVAYLLYDGQKRTGGTSSSFGDTLANGDIVGIALDLDNNKVYFSKNGTFQASGDPASNLNGISVTAPASTDTGFYFIGVQDAGNGSPGTTYKVNFGNPPFTISSGNSDGNGYGNFEYSVPSGYYALNTKNLAEYG